MPSNHTLIVDAADSSVIAQIHQVRRKLWAVNEAVALKFTAQTARAWKTGDATVAKRGTSEACTEAIEALDALAAAGPLEGGYEVYVRLRDLQRKIASEVSA